MLDSSNRFVLSNYQQMKPFASFLPGIAGPLGVPLWAFYVNRGQAIASFGVESKDSPILEFQSANKAYQQTPYTGFRTFLKISSGAVTRLYEPFAPWNREAEAVQRMACGLNELEIRETSLRHGLETTVTYFVLPGEPYAGLARRLTLRNLSQAPLRLEILDGLPSVIPYGVSNGLLKEIGRTVEAWMEVFNREAGVPFYRLRASVIDRPEVATYQAGHFALALAGAGQPQLLPALVDPAVVFEADTSLAYPQGFARQPLESLLGCRQVTCGRMPCAFFAQQAVLEPDQTLTLNSLYGHIGGLELLPPKVLPRLTQPGYFEAKYLEAVSLAQDLSDVVETHTANPIFDAYCRQTLLDNVLRGGWPALLGDPHHPHVYPIYSRKHGDLERDYNAFFLAPEPYSQGEGSYRDVNQNRRDNVFFNPAAGDSDVRTFASLLQTDGYNPRTLCGSTFTLSPDDQAAVLDALPEPEKLRSILAAPFTPGKLLKAVAEQEIALPAGQNPDAFLAFVLQNAVQHLEADFFEGFWIDHWVYTLDLVESYLAVFPDRQDALLFGKADLPFFDSPVFVQPRSRKYVLFHDVPRQVGSLEEDPEKAALIASRSYDRNWMRADCGQGKIYRATLFAKVTLTALLKFATLDPWGMGIEMEAGRPGWYDALNGLPALFGSGMAETYELQRWLIFLRAAIRTHGPGEIRLPLEAANLLQDVLHRLADYELSSGPEKEFIYWDAVSTARENYRARTRLGVDGAEQIFSLAELDAALAVFQRKVTAGIARALELNGGFPPTYFTFTLDEYDALPEANPAGQPYLRPVRFTPHPLPPFLEGPVRAMRILPGATAARRLHRQVKSGPLYDRALKMYKVNASLEALPQDIGRARAFPPGWLENESIWLHMEYKYLLELLRAGLYHEFFVDMRTALVPFLDPQTYGRSTLENASFLASSAHPDPSLHGAGFVARLSGSTAEFLSMWRILLAGQKPFILDLNGGQLCLALRPVLPSWLFPASGEISFRFLGRCLVTYHNPKRLDTFDPACQVQHVLLYPAGASSIPLQGGLIPSPFAAWVREGKIDRIDVYF